jgi:two-component SAPR family response regulator
MVVEIKKPVTKEKLLRAIATLKKANKEKSIRKHFGKLKRGLEGTTYQKKVRNEWA